MNVSSTRVFPHVDLLVVGAGIVGLAHAAAALERGMSVAVVERDERCVGASIRNFGHASITAQSDRSLELGLAGRSRWIALSRAAGFWLSECGTVVLARSDDEVDVLEEFAAARDADQVRLVDRADIGDHLPSYDAEALRAAFLPLDLRVDPREAIPAIAAWLERSGARFHWSTTLAGVADGVAETSRGTMTADHVVVCVGHDVDRIAPEVAAEFDVLRCYLQMLEVEPPTSMALEPALLSGLSMLRYPALRSCPSAERVRARIRRDDPAFLDNELNLMVTRRPDGNLVLGDSHHYARTPDPFESEAVADLLLREGRKLLGADALRVRRRWRGVYASSRLTDNLVSSLDARSHLVSVTSGIGMTVALGLATEVIASLGGIP